jgi:hypothetical protein
MSERGSNWNVPADWLWHFGIFFTVGCSTLLASLLLPVVARLKTADITNLYGCALGVGFLGIVILLLARLPLYRQHRFWSFGPRHLPRKHRLFYWLAYATILVRERAKTK